MMSFLQKIVAQVNTETKEGKSVVVTVPLLAPAADAKKPSGVAVVTTATLANNMYNLPRPVPIPDKQSKD